MSKAIKIQLIERGAAQVVAIQDWLSAGCELEARELVKKGVVKLTASGDHILVEPKTLVGSFFSSRLTVDVKPKFEYLSGTLLTMLKEWRKYVHHKQDDKDGAFRQDATAWRTFEVLLTNFLREGLPWAYTSVIHDTSAPRGRILFQDTVTKLHSRGVAHRVFSRAQIREYVADIAPSLAAVCRKLEMIEPSTTEFIRRVRRLINSIGECNKIFSEVAASDKLKSLLNWEGRPALREIAYFGSELLGGKDEFRVSETIGSGVAEFVDMEKLWEHAIQMLIAMKLQPYIVEVVMHPLRGSITRLFNDGGPKLDPDIIVQREKKMLAIVDAKYSSASSPSADDVYQMTCYCTRLQAKVGLIAYVSDTDVSRVSRIGTLENGAPIFACYISLNAFNPSNAFMANVVSIVANAI